MADRFDRSFPEVALVLSRGTLERKGMAAQAELVNDAIDFANYPLTRRSSKKRLLSELGWEGEDAEQRLLLAARLATATFDRISQIEIEKGLERPVKRKRALGKRAMDKQQGAARAEGQAVEDDTIVSISAEQAVAPKAPIPPRYSYAIPHIDIEGDDGMDEQEQLGKVHLTDDTAGDLFERMSKTALLTAEQEVELAKKIEAGLYATQVLEGNVKLKRRRNRTKATPEELQIIAREGDAAKEHMIRANMRLVANLANKYFYTRMPLSDLISEGNFGLIRAVEKFDYTKGYKFSTYASWWIKQSIQRGIANTGDTIRLPVHTKEAVNKLSRAQRTLMMKNGREPTPEELADECDMPEAKVINLLTRARQMVSLDQAITDKKGDPGDTTFGDLFAAQPDFVDDMIHVQTAQGAAHQVLASVDPRAAHMLRMRYGIIGGREHTLDEIAKAHMLTKERVRQILGKATTRIRASSEQDGSDQVIADYLNGG